MTSYALCKTGSLAVFKVTARDQGHYKGPSGAFVTYCNIFFCFFFFVFFFFLFFFISVLKNQPDVIVIQKHTLLIDILNFQEH